MSSSVPFFVRIFGCGDRRINFAAFGKDATHKQIDDPPRHLLLGTDALRRAGEKVDAVIEEMDRWEEVTHSTDFPQNTPA